MGAFREIGTTVFLPRFPGAAFGKFGHQRLARFEIFHGVFLAEKIVRAVHDGTLQFDRKRVFVHFKPLAEAQDAGRKLVISHHLCVRTAYACLHLADAREFVRARQRGDGRVQSALEAVLDIEAVGVGGKAVDVDRESITVTQPHGPGRGEREFDSAPNGDPRPRLHHGETSAIDDRQAGTDELRQHEAHQRLGVLLGERARNGHRRGRARGGTGERPEGDAETRDLEDGVHFVVGDGERADGRDCQREDFFGFADHLRHADDGARFGGILHAGTLQGLGGVRQGVAVHGE